MLIEERHGFERLDLSPEAWADQGQAILARANVVSHWQGRYHAPPPAPPEAIGKADAETLLRALLEQRDERYEAACFILAAMLERKKAIRLRGQTKDGTRRIFLYEHAASGDTFAIPDPELHLDQLENVQTEVARLLETGLPAPAQPAEEPFNAPSEVATLAGA